MAKPKTTFAPLVAADVTINAAEVTNATTLAVTATVKGLRVGYPVLVWGPSLEADLVITNAYASAKDELTFSLGNISAAPINPASQVFKVVQF